LIVKSSVGILFSMQDTELFKELGARLLTTRIQVKDWNETEAATAAGLAPKTIRRIERGLNYEWASVEKYALALGKPLAAWLRDILVKEETQRSVVPVETRATGTAGHPFPSTDRRRVSLGPPKGVSERRGEAASGADRVVAPQESRRNQG
jgi:transcriptional regulator with XRE-family HTH domain